MATVMYADDYDECGPGHRSSANDADNWPQMLLPYCKNAQIFHCPSSSQANTSMWDHFAVNGTVPLSYGTNCYYFGNKPLAQARNSAGTLLITDSIGDNRIGPEYTVREAKVANCWDGLAPRHNELLNAGFVDGHAKAMKLSTIQADDARWFNPALAQ